MFLNINKVPYPRYCSPGVLFFDMGFWMGSNSKNHSKSGVFNPQKLDFSITWAQWAMKLVKGVKI